MNLELNGAEAVTVTKALLANERIADGGEVYRGRRILAKIAECDEKGNLKRLMVKEMGHDTWHGSVWVWWAESREAFEKRYRPGLIARTAPPKRGRECASE